MSSDLLSRFLGRVLPSLCGFNAVEFVKRGVAIASLIVGVLAAAVAPGGAQRSLPTVGIQGAARMVVRPGDAFTLTVAATGTGPVAYRWYHDNRLMAGKTGATLNLASVMMADAGAYTAMATDSVGSPLSEPAFVLVAPAHTRGLLWVPNALLQRVRVPQWRDVVAFAQVGEFSLTSPDD